MFGNVPYRLIDVRLERMLFLDVAAPPTVRLSIEAVEEGLEVGGSSAEGKRWVVTIKAMFGAEGQEWVQHVAMGLSLDEAPAPLPVDLPAIDRKSVV